MPGRNQASNGCHHELKYFECLICYPTEGKGALEALQHPPEQHFKLIQAEMTQAFRHRSPANNKPENSRQGPSMMPTISNTAQMFSAPSNPYISPRQSGTKHSYSPRSNKIGAEQTYAMNRLLDEIPDFRARGILLDDAQADTRNVGHRAALGTRLRRLEFMIGI